MASLHSNLIVDADPMTLDALRSLLNRLGPLKILEARDLLEAKTAVERSRPDIILVNHKLPWLDGVQVTQTILTSVSESRVIFLADDNSMVHSAFGAGALGYLRRNQVESDLQAAIDQLMLGRTFFTAEIVRLLRLRHHRNPYPAEHKDFSSREVNILQQIALGTPNDEIGTKLGLSTRTIEGHRATIMKKIGAQSVSELVRYAIRTGMIEA